jgi:hypothetical protein
MPRYTVNVPEYALRRKYTPGQFLAEFAEVTGRSKVRDLRHPVRVTYVTRGEEKVSEVCRTASAIFALFQRVAVAKGALASLSWKGCRIGTAGLYELNHAIREPARRKGGLNIVRHWLETRRGCLTPLGVDLAALFDFLEIRPIFRGKTPAPTLPFPAEPPLRSAKRYRLCLKSNKT